MFNSISIWFGKSITVFFEAEGWKSHLQPSSSLYFCSFKDFLVVALSESSFKNIYRHTHCYNYKQWQRNYTYIQHIQTRCYKQSLDKQHMREQSQQIQRHNKTKQTKKSTPQHIIDWGWERRRAHRECIAIMKRWLMKWDDLNWEHELAVVNGRIRCLYIHPRGSTSFPTVDNRTIQIYHFWNLIFI